MDLFRQLRAVAGADLWLCSDSVCWSCQGSILTAAKQKQRYEKSWRQLIQKLIPAPVFPCNMQPSPAKAMVSLTPPRLPSWPEKLPWSSPLGISGISPLAKRPLSEARNTKEHSKSPAPVCHHKLPVEVAQEKLTTPAPHCALFPNSACAHVLPSKIPLASTRSRGPCPPVTSSCQVIQLGWRMCMNFAILRWGVLHFSAFH